MHSDDNPEHHLTESAINDMAVSEFRYTLPSQLRKFEDVLKDVFKLERRGVTVTSELFAGLVHFISCLYVLPVVPQQLAKAGYPAISTAVITAACCGIGSIAFGLFANLPFIVAPPTAVSIFLSSYLQVSGLSYTDGNQAVIVSGCALLILGYRPLGRLMSQLVPSSIQISTAIGIGMLTALAGCTEINLIVKGRYTLVELGPLSPEMEIAMAGVLLLGIGLHYHMKGGFCFTLIVCSIAYWVVKSDFPKSIAEFPKAPFYSDLGSQALSEPVNRLIVDFVFLYFVTLNGLGRAFSDLAEITAEKDGLAVVPRGRWMYIICGVMTIFSGCFGGPPMLISPESGSGIKSGAKTGLSAVFGGILFCIATFFAPLFQAVPAAGTAPLLIAIGIILFVNVTKIDWTDYTQAFPGFIVLFLIPFAYSILDGVVWGWAAWLVINFVSGDLWRHTSNLILMYSPALHEAIFNSNRFSSTGNTAEYVRSVFGAVWTMEWHIGDMCKYLWYEIFNFDDKDDENAAEPLILGAVSHFNVHTGGTVSISHVSESAHSTNSNRNQQLIINNLNNLSGPGGNRIRSGSRTSRNTSIVSAGSLTVPLTLNDNNDINVFARTASKDTSDKNY